MDRHTEILKSKPMQVLERRLGRDLGEYLRTEYVEKGRTGRDIAAECGVTETSVFRWMALYGIEPRFPGTRGRAA